MNCSASPSTLRPNAPHFKPDAANTCALPIPKHVPLYGTMHGAAYASYENCTATGLPLSSAVQQAAITPQVSVREMGSVPEDLGILSPALLTELEEVSRSIDASYPDAMILCRCDDSSRWVPAHARGEENRCVNIAGMGGGVRPAGEVPGQQDIKWSRILSQKTDPSFQQSLGNSADPSGPSANNSDTQSMRPNESSRPDNVTHSASVSTFSNVRSKYEGQSPQEKQRGREIVNDLWTSAYQKVYKGDCTAVEAEEGTHGFPDWSKEREVDNLKKLRRGWSI